MIGQIVILSGPSGVGKDTVIDAWCASNPRVQRVVAATTRDAREGELDGHDYHFISAEEFEWGIASGKFLEYKKVHSRLYGTPLESVDMLLREGKIAVLKIDVQGAAAVLDKMPHVCSIFILPPSNEELERRIRGRGTETEERIIERMDNARKELRMSAIYRHRVVNDDIDRAVAEIDEIVKEHHG